MLTGGESDPVSGTLSLDSTGKGGSALRKLATAALAFSAAVFAAKLLLPLALLPWLAGGLGLLALLLFLSRRRWLLPLALLALGLSLGCLSFFCHAQRTLLPAQSLDGETREIRGEVCSYPLGAERYSRLELRISGRGLPRGKMILYADGDALLAFQPGDRIVCEAKLKRSDLRYGERYDSYLSRGVYLTGNARSQPLLEGSGGRLRYLPLRLNRALCQKILEIYPADTAAFMQSLLLGEKNGLYEDLELHLAMSRAGFLHIVAVSGMHIAFLVGLIQLLFGKTWRSSLFCLLLVWFFVLVTGSSPSAVRAAVMQSFLLAAPLVRRENDPITALSAALALLLLANPFAAGSVGLQLSFSAMAGILCFAEPLQRAFSGMLPEHWAHRLRGLTGTAAGSLAVLAFSVPVTAWHFGSLALLSPLSNLLGLWAVSLCFCGGFLSCLLGFLSTTLGSAAAWLVSWLVRYIILLAKLVASVPWGVLILRNLPSYLWVLLVYLLIALSCFSRMKTWQKLLMPLVLAGAMLVLLQLRTRADTRSGSGIISVIDVGQGQSIAVMAGDKTLLIDCGSINSLQNAGKTAGEYLLSCGREQVDVLMLTHLHADHANGVSMLMEMLPVRILLLSPELEDEDELLEEILQAADKHGVQLRYLQGDAQLHLGEIQGKIFAPLARGESNERCLTGVFSLGEYDMLVTGDSSKSTEKELLRLHPLQDLELLIVGHHGSRYASCGELLGSIGAKTAVISVGYNTYGHPTYETLERLAAYGYRIYRTDLNGTVEIRVGY